MREHAGRDPIVGLPALTHDGSKRMETRRN